MDSSPITSTADIYCNPLWVTVEGRNSVPQPGDALFYSGANSGLILLERAGNPLFTVSSDLLIT